MSRYAEPDGTVYVFRCQIPEHRGMVGEIVRTPLGRMRVHCWSAANPGEYREPQERFSALIVPKPPAWKPQGEDLRSYMGYFDTPQEAR